MDSTATGLLADKSFTIKNVVKGYYYITKEKVGDVYMYAVNGPFSTETLCTTDWDTESAKNTDLALTDDGTCKEYDTIPDTPANTTASSTTASEAVTETNYYPLASLPGLGETCTPDNSVPPKTICVKTGTSSGGIGFAGYLNIMIKIFDVSRI